MKGYFEMVWIIFRVAGHTKNTVNWLFNLLKLDYWKENIFSLTKLIQVCNDNEYAIAHQVNSRVSDNLNELCDIYLNKLEANKIYQIFQWFHSQSYRGMIQCHKSHLYGCTPVQDYLLKNNQLIMITRRKLTRTTFCRMFKTDVVLKISFQDHCQRAIWLFFVTS